ncbi:hypothetical protein KZX62_25930 [Paenibacillus silvae]|uniref:hypothetical protein n=1 Tax=Paenibacillus silvae TaxID=1325358 RepID=UPI0020033930|nr:hypothetical protein [Paenibacillus silvae]MCK6152671.1 hypothetical protein [Paenibacillus silvae]
MYLENVDNCAALPNFKIQLLHQLDTICGYPVCISSKCGQLFRKQVGDMFLSTDMLAFVKIVLYSSSYE